MDNASAISAKVQLSLCCCVGFGTSIDISNGLKLMCEAAQEGSAQAQAVVVRLHTSLDRPWTMSESCMKRWLFDGMTDGSRVASEDLFRLYPDIYQEARAQIVARSRQPLEQRLSKYLSEIRHSTFVTTDKQDHLRQFVDGKHFLQRLLDPLAPPLISYAEECWQGLREILSEPDKKGETPALIACRAADFTLARYLVRHARGISEPVRRRGDTPAHWLINFRDPAEACVLAKDLVTVKVDLTHSTSADCPLSEQTHLMNSIAEFTTPLHWAIEHDRLQLAKRLVELDPRVLDTGSRYDNLVAWAAHHQSESCLQWLCNTPDHQQKIRESDSFGHYPLYYAARADDVRRLLRYDCYHPRSDSHATNEGGGELSPAVWRAKERTVISVLLSKDWGQTFTKQDLRVAADDTFNALHQLAARGDVYLLDYLLNRIGHKDDLLSSTSDTGLTPLAIAIVYGNWDAFQHLLSSGADTKKGDVTREDHCLHVSAFSRGYRTTEFAEKLLEKDFAAIEIRNEVGESPLHHAALANRTDLVELYLERGASIDCRDHWGHTPLAEAISSRSLGTVELLVEKLEDRCIPRLAKRKPDMSALAYSLSLRGSGYGNGCFDLPLSEQSDAVIRYLLGNHHPTDKLSTQRWVTFYHRYNYENIGNLVLSPTLTGNVDLLKRILGSGKISGINYRYYMSKAFLQRFLDDDSHVASDKDRRLVVDYWQYAYDEHWKEVRGVRSRKPFLFGPLWRLYYSMYGNLAKRQQDRYDKWRQEKRFYRRSPGFELEPYTSNGLNTFYVSLFGFVIPSTVVYATTTWLVALLSYVVYLSKDSSARSVIVAFYEIAIVSDRPMSSEGWQLNLHRQPSGPFGTTLFALPQRIIIACKKLSILMR